MKSVGTYATGTTTPDGTPRRAIGYFDGRLGCAFSLPSSLNGWQLPSLKDCAAILAGESVACAMNDFNLAAAYSEFETFCGSPLVMVTPSAPLEEMLDAVLEKLPCSELDDLVAQFLRHARFCMVGSEQFDAHHYDEPNKQILVVIGGVTFTSLPVGPAEARHVLESVKRAAPNTDPMIVVAK